MKTGDGKNDLFHFLIPVMISDFFFSFFILYFVSIFLLRFLFLAFFLLIFFYSFIRLFVQFSLSFSLLSLLFCPSQHWFKPFQYHMTGKKKTKKMLLWNPWHLNDNYCLFFQPIPILIPEPFQGNKEGGRVRRGVGGRGKTDARGRGRGMGMGRGVLITH